jgi:SAM-dependent methyltransferase
VRVDLEQFERLYRSARDPWEFATSPYEQHKYDVTVAALPRPRYRRCFEPGCSIGALTSRLAARVDEVIAADASVTATRIATERLQSFPNVVVTNDSIPDQWPDADFDLIVWSELGYYWDQTELRPIIEHARSLLTDDGHFLSVHWLGHSNDHLLSGAEVHSIITESFGVPIVHHSEPQFVLDLWTRS